MSPLQHGSAAQIGSCVGVGRLCATQGRSLLMKEFSARGYVLLQSFFDPKTIARVRSSAINAMDQIGLDLGSSFDVNEFARKVVVAERKIGALTDLVQGPDVMEIATSLLGGTCSVFDGSWLRLVQPGQSTQPHRDTDYLRRAIKLVTTWVPISHIPFNSGGLSLFDETTGRWLTSDYQPGDLLAFESSILHRATANTLDVLRLSIDTRFCSARDASLAIVKKPKLVQIVADAPPR